MNSCNHIEKDTISKRAKETAVEFMKEKENINFVPKDVEYTNAVGGGTVWVEGYDKEEPSQKYSVTVNYEDDKYTVGGVGSGDEVKTDQE
ncbi:hypothetical protein COJ96_25120 [Bacillus sp. AFS073361]|nr:hypothetical protein COJ96_25120 [Bacillus sp. AFS073361]